MSDEHDELEAARKVVEMARKHLWGPFEYASLNLTDAIAEYDHVTGRVPRRD